jgi:hypothetical protein
MFPLYTIDRVAAVFGFGVGGGIQEGEAGTDLLQGGGWHISSFYMQVNYNVLL